MSNLFIKRIQVGNSTQANNFVIQQPDVADATLRIASGNIGSSTNIITINSAGNITANGTITANTVSATNMTVGGASVLTATTAPFLGTNSIIRTNSNSISQNITIPSGTNGVTAGPVSIANGFTVTVNGDWSIV
jgi:hypothetical protein